MVETGFSHGEVDLGAYKGPDDDAVALWKGLDNWICRWEIVGKRKMFRALRLVAMYLRDLVRHIIAAGDEKQNI